MEKEPQVDYHGERGRRYLELRTGGDRFSVQRTTTCSLTLLTRMRLTDSSKTGRTCALMKKCALIRKVRLTTRVYGTSNNANEKLQGPIHLTLCMK